MALNLFRDVSNSSLMKSRKLLIYIAGVTLLLPVLAAGIDLDEVGRIALEDGDRVYGQSTGNIIIANDSSLTFYDSTFNIRHRLILDSLQSALVADNGLYYAIVEPGPEPVSDSSGKIITIYNNSQIPLWGAFDIKYGDYYLSPSGDYIVTVTGTPGYYDFEIHVNHNQLPPAGGKIEFFESINFADDGRLFNVDCGLKGGKIFGSDGQMADSTGKQQACAFSENNEFYALYDRGVVNVYRNKKLYSTHEFRKPRIVRLAIRAKSNHLLAAFSDIVALNNLDDGTTIWSYGLQHERSRYVSMDVSPDGKYVACGVDINEGRDVLKENRHVIGFLYLYDIEGESILFKQFRYSSYTDGTPMVRFGPHSRKVYVLTRENLHIISLY